MVKFFKPTGISSSRRNIRRNSISQLLLGLVFIVLLNIIGSYLFYRFDLTSEKRYSLSPATKKMLKNLDDVVYFKVYLEGDFPAGFKRLRNETREMLGEFRAYSDNIQFEFINPSASSSQSERENTYQRLVESGLNPTNLQVRQEGGMSEQIIFPGALVSYKNKEFPLELLHSQLGTPPEEVLNNSVQSLEYTLANAISKLSSSDRPSVAFIEGHGELPELLTADAQNSLSEYYKVERVKINGMLSSLTRRVPKGKDSTDYIVKNKYKAIIIAKPDSAFPEKDKFIIDQYVMRGGKILWLVDPVFASMDSLQNQDQTIGIGMNLNLDDLFFNYGCRLNPDLIMDLNAMRIPMVTGQMGDQPKMEMLPWYYFPVVFATSTHPIVRNLNALKTEFVSSIDTITAPNIRKTILLSTSRYSRLLNSPALITTEVMRQQPDMARYNNPYRTIALLLEGNFPSLFLNRIPPELAGAPEIQFIDHSKPTAMIVVSDGDIVKNQLQSSPTGPSPLPLGYDRYSRETFGNKDFIMNAMNYLCDDSGLLSVRSKELKLRLLDGEKINAEKVKWQLINVLLPVLIILAFGVIQHFVRRYKYTRPF
ncbi:MAG TPA: gliding motility-associated ABC transporter substrate-binding protein GldG [Bacteroidales bacterium]|nr:gliding motility-associated ABC transporter substrate-binding protein GldG [Bacteroidales bacterium]HPT02901.1 gliding motility-associated ABC transporter substrate-binding protein GldG [Bacteroidales bacterium]